MILFHIYIYIYIAIYLFMVAKDIMTSAQEKVLSNMTQPIFLQDSSCVCMLLSL